MTADTLHISCGCYLQPLFAQSLIHSQVKWNVLVLVPGSPSHSPDAPAAVEQKFTAPLSCRWTMRAALVSYEGALQCWDSRCVSGHLECENLRLTDGERRYERTRRPSPYLTQWFSRFTLCPRAQSTKRRSREQQLWEREGKHAVCVYLCQDVNPISGREKECGCFSCVEQTESQHEHGVCCVPTDLLLGTFKLNLLQNIETLWSCYKIIYSSKLTLCIYI